jgi:hypothetical protein
MEVLSITARLSVISLSSMDWRETASMRSDMCSGRGARQPATAAIHGEQEATHAAPPTDNAKTQENRMNNGARSPAGESHPGQIVHDDKVDGRTWTRAAAEVPMTIAWVEVNGTRKPVVRIEITDVTVRGVRRQAGDDGWRISRALVRNGRHHPCLERDRPADEHVGVQVRVAAVRLDHDLPAAMPDLRSALWLGALMLAAGCSVTAWPDELDELAADYFALFPLAART